MSRVKRYFFCLRNGTRILFSIKVNYIYMYTYFTIRVFYNFPFYLCVKIVLKFFLHCFLIWLYCIIIWLLKILKKSNTNSMWIAHSFVIHVGFTQTYTYTSGRIACARDKARLCSRVDPRIVAPARFYRTEATAGESR